MEPDAGRLEGLAMGMVAAATRVGVVMLYVKRIAAFAAAGASTVLVDELDAFRFRIRANDLDRGRG